MTKAPLNLEVGTRLHLQPENGDPGQGIEASLIGFVPGESLLATCPPDAGLSKDSLYNVRVAIGDSICTFQSKILLVCDQPFPYIHMQYPEGVEGFNLRRAHRLPISKPAIAINIQDEQMNQPVTMLDISTFGARLIAEQPIGEIGHQFYIDIKGNSPSEQTTLPCIIRYIQQDNAANDAPSFHHGVEFLKLEEKPLSFITRLIKDKLTKQRKR